MAVKTPVWTGFHVVYSRFPPLQIELESPTSCLIQKSKVMYFTRKKVPGNLKIMLYNQPLERGEKFKYLGVWFDDKLLWKFHIEYMETKCKKVINLMRMVTGHYWGADRPSLMNLYKALIRSTFDYGCNQLCEFLQENNIYEDFQSGFRANHSTETALAKVTNDLLIASDQGFVSVLVLLDLSAAFDTIDHAILLQRLEQLISIKGTALSWFKSYFADRFQFVQINDESSVHTKVNHGVPQGSVLGPILFSIYMLPLGNIIRTHSVNFHCYADDTQLYLSIKPEQSNQLTKLQTCLKDIKTWMTRNFLLLNSDKTEVIILAPKHLRDTLSNDIAALDDIALASNETVRNLGVIFDPDLSFDLQNQEPA